MSSSVIIKEQKSTEEIDHFSTRYKVLGEIGEGSYSKVLKCRKRESGEVFACKRLKHTYRSWGHVADIPEIVTLRKLVKHPNVLQMSEIHFDPNLGRVSLVFELMDMNLYELIKDRKRLLQESRCRSMIFQLIRGLRHLHKHGIFHRDVKPENILIKRSINDEDEVVKLGDLGSVRGLYSRPPYTEYISTRWYRSPECLLTAGYYSIKMDIWATGCVFYEILTLRPLFPGSSEVDQINRIHNILGPPPPKILHKFSKFTQENRHHRHHKEARFDNIKKTINDLCNGNTKSANFEWYFSGKNKDSGGVERLLPTHVSSEAKDLLDHLLQYDPELRPTTHRAINHSYFKGLREIARKVSTEIFPGEVTVSIGPSVKKLSELDGVSPDLKTLGDTKAKRHAAKTTVSKIPILVKLAAKDMALNFNTVNIPNSNNSEREIPPPIYKDETKGKVGSYEEFAAKSKASLPYEIVHLGRKRTVDKEPMRMYQDDEFDSSSNLFHLPGEEKDDTSSHNRLKDVSRTRELTKKSSFAREFIDRTTLSPGALHRINENRRLVHLQPIGSVDISPVREQENSDSSLGTRLPTKKRNLEMKKALQQRNLQVDHMLTTKYDENKLPYEVLNKNRRNNNNNEEMEIKETTLKEKLSFSNFQQKTFQGDEIQNTKIFQKPDMRRISRTRSIQQPSQIPRHKLPEIKSPTPIPLLKQFRPSPSSKLEKNLPPFHDSALRAKKEASEQLVKRRSTNQTIIPTLLEPVLMKRTNQQHQPNSTLIVDSLTTKRLHKPTSTLLDYQQFAAKYKPLAFDTQSIHHPDVRRRREAKIPSESSSNEKLPPHQEIYNGNKLNKTRSLQKAPSIQTHRLRRDTNHDPSKEKRDGGRSPVKEKRRSLVDTSTENYGQNIQEKEKYEFLSKGPSENSFAKQKIQRLQSFLQSTQRYQQKTEESKTEKVRLEVSDDLSSDGPLIHSNSTFTGLRKFRGSEGILPRLKDQSGGSVLQKSNSYYPSNIGRIKVSKPSLLRPDFGAPPLKTDSKVRQMSIFGTPYDPPPKLQRETVAKKKYSFFHEKQDYFTSNKKSKLK